MKLFVKSHWEVPFQSKEEMRRGRRMGVDSEVKLNFTARHQVRTKLLLTIHTADMKSTARSVGGQVYINFNASNNQITHIPAEQNSEIETCRRLIPWIDEYRNSGYSYSANFCIKESVEVVYIHISNLDS